MNSLQAGLKKLNPNYLHVLEFGVWQVTTLRLIRDTLDSKYDVFGFDSFQGLPEDWPDTPCAKGHFSTQGLEPYIPGAVIFPGWFKDTLPQYVFQGRPIALLHLDCDLYSSTKEVMTALNQFIMPDTIIVCDEWIYTKNDGSHGVDQEQKAVWEWSQEFDRAFEIIPFEDATPQGHERSILRVIR
jgi:hypothetical protein